MKPVNAKERRIQFFRFIVLFLLALLPVVIFMDRLNRIDKQSCDYFKNKYNEMQAGLDAGKDNGGLIQEVYAAGQLLRSNVNNQAGGMKEFMNLESSRLGNEVNGLDNAILALRSANSSSKNDVDLANLATAYLELSKLCLNVYETGYNRIAEVKKKSDELDKKIKEEYMPQLTTCNNDLANCRAANGRN